MRCGASVSRLWDRAKIPTGPTVSLGEAMHVALCSGSAGCCQSSHVGGPASPRPPPPDPGLSGPPRPGFSQVQFDASLGVGSLDDRSGFPGI